MKQTWRGSLEANVYSWQVAGRESKVEDTLARFTNQPLKPTVSSRYQQPLTRYRNMSYFISFFRKLTKIVLYQTFNTFSDLYNYNMVEVLFMIYKLTSIYDIITIHLPNLSCNVTEEELTDKIKTSTFLETKFGRKHSSE